jgi:hypothetical protein
MMVYNWVIRESTYLLEMLPFPWMLTTVIIPGSISTEILPSGRWN